MGETYHCHMLTKLTNALPTRGLILDLGTQNMFASIVMWSNQKMIHKPCKKHKNKKRKKACNQCEWRPDTVQESLLRNKSLIYALEIMYKNRKPRE